MSDLLLGTLSLLLATNPPAAVVSNYVSHRLAPFAAVAGSPAVDPQDPVEIEFRELLRADEAAETEIEQVLAQGAPSDPARGETPTAGREAVRQQLLEIITRMRGRYEAFLKKHPRHVRARLAYGDHLSEYGDEEEVVVQLGVALELDPKNAVVWNNYAGHFAHVGSITNAFHAYERAMELRPYEPLYHYNYGTVIFLYRKDAREYYGCDEAAVFERALAHYREARRLAPRHFRYAFDYAQTFYGVNIAPTKTEEERREAEQRLADRALTAWEEALSLANNETDREGIFIHFARWQIKAGRWEDARASLARVTRPEHAEMKRMQERNLAFREAAPLAEPELPGSIPAPKLQLESPLPQKPGN